MELVGPQAILPQLAVVRLEQHTELVLLRRNQQDLRVQQLVQQ
jgi:hypothetical protein